MTNLALGKTTVPYSGASSSYTVVTNNTQLVAKLWAGAGAGGHWPNGLSPNGGIGGPAGYTTITLNLSLGDVVKVEVGQGGQPGTVTGGTTGNYTGTGGLGGWPDGGDAGFDKAASPGGGGGSTRLYVNNVLVAVAGAGGGDGIGQTNRTAGPGGGTNGGNGVQTLDGTNAAPTGGSQSAGGVNQAQSSETQMKGASLQGGKGYPAASSNSNGTLGTSGGGGGGGYFGGAGGGKAGQYVNGGAGGSGYFNTGATGYVSGSTTAGTSTVPGNNSDTDKPAGVGAGGTSTNSGTISVQAGAGGNGAAVFSVTGSTTLAAGKTTVNYLGADSLYDISADGTLTIKLWGAGGASTTVTNSSFPRKGGPGGYVTITIPVLAGDQIKVKVGGGGQLPSVGTGGPGGWPDGGGGGRNTSSEPDNSGGGGGGATYIYLNNVLYAIAGGGGGAMSLRTQAGTVINGGPAGDTPASDGYASSSGVWSNGRGQGGSQSAGGLGGTNTNGQQSTHDGAANTGGKGYASSITTSDNNLGGGGGGGQYGGGGGAGAAGSTVVGPGGGGSNYIKSGVTGSAGTPNSSPTSRPPNTGDSDYVTGKGYGGGDTVGTASAGGDGLVVFDNVPNQAASTGGSIGTVTMGTAPAGSAAAGVSASAGIGTVTMSAPDATVGVSFTAGSIGIVYTSPVEGDAASGTPGNAAGDIGTVNVANLIVAGPETEALVVLDLESELNAVVSSWTEDGDFATGAVDLDLDHHDVTVNLVAPTAEALGDLPEPGDAAGDIGEITVVAVEGFAAQALVEPGLPGLSIEAVTGEAVGNAYVAIAELYLVTVTPILGSVHTPDMSTGGALGTVIVTHIHGDAFAGDDLTVAVGQEAPPVVISPVEAVAGGNASAVGIPSYIGGILDVAMARAVVTPPEASATGGANLNYVGTLTVHISPLAAILHLAQSINAPIKTINVRRIIGFAGEAPDVLEGDAYPADEFTDITITPVEADYAVAGEASGDLPVILLTAPNAAPGGGQDFAAALADAVVVSAIAGGAEEVTDAANADLTAVVTISGPEGSVTVTATGALATIRVSAILTSFPVILILGSATVAETVSGTAIVREVENADAVVESVLETTAIVRG